MGILWKEFIKESSANNFCDTWKGVVYYKCNSIVVWYFFPKNDWVFCSYSLQLVISEVFLIFFPRIYVTNIEKSVSGRELSKTGLDVGSQTFALKDSSLNILYLNLLHEFFKRITQLISLIYWRKLWNFFFCGEKISGCWRYRSWDADSIFWRDWIYSEKCKEWENIASGM